VNRASATPAGTLVLDSEGLAKAVLRAREVTQWLALARADDLRVITSAATVVEVAHPRLNWPALEWTLSRVVVEPVTEPIARRATAILAEAGLHGHRHAIDAMLSATALAAPGPVTVLTSDPEDIATLCGRNVTVIKVLCDGPGAKGAGRARRSGSAHAKAARKTGPGGQPLRSFHDLLDHLAALTRDAIRIAGQPVDKLTTPTPDLRKAFDLIGAPIPLPWPTT
jgi:predicted nucleic acid-binding protein